MFGTRDTAVVLGFLAATTLFAASADAQDHECTCRAPGRRVALGETICLMTPKGLRLARCEMDLNITSWTILETPCPTAALPDDGRTAPSSRRPVVADRDVEARTEVR